MPRSLVHAAAMLLPLAAAAGLFVGPARADARAATCGAGSYAYAGVMGTASVAGVAATITSLEAPVVASGHVAGWVGVGGAGIGPNGADDWLQVGLNSVPGSGNKLYYEVAQPGSPVAYHQLDSNVPAGRQLRLAVLEMAGRPRWWRVWVDGDAVTPPIYLPGSHGSWPAVATAESWAGAAGACNRYAYRFDQVATTAAPGGGWRQIAGATTLEDAGYRLVRESAATFVARTES